MLGGPLSIGFPRRLYRRLKKPFETMERCRIGQVDVLDLDFTIGCFYANDRRDENSMNPDPDNVLVPYVGRPKTQEPRRNCYGIVRQRELAPPTMRRRNSRLANDKKTAEARNARRGGKRDEAPPARVIVAIPKKSAIASSLGLYGMLWGSVISDLDHSTFAAVSVNCRSSVRSMEPPF